MSHNENDSLINNSDFINRSYKSMSLQLDENNDTIVYCIHGLNSNLCCEVTCSKGGQSSLKRKFELPHCHFYDEEQSRFDKQARWRLIVASILCLIFMIIEIVGGYLANSLAIASDAAHLLTDFASFMISLFSIYLGSRPASKQMSFGWHRAEVIGALTSVLMIWLVTGILCYIATNRIITGDFEIGGTVMLITALFGVIVNIIMGLALTLGRVPHGHSHGTENERHENFSGSNHQGRKNINVRAAFIHVLGDFFQSIGVLIASLIIYVWPTLQIVDPLCTFLFSFIVLFTTTTIIKDVLNVLMEGIPKGIDVKQVQQTLFNIEGVCKVHNLRIWSLSMDKAALSTHLAIEKSFDSTKILNSALREIKSRYDIYELTIQIEEYREEMDDCHRCNK